MEVVETKKLFINSKTLEHLFGFDINVPTSKDSFAESLLNAIHFEEMIDKIKKITKTLELKEVSREEAKDLEPGTVCVFEVDVVCEGDNLNVLEMVCI